MLPSLCNDGNGNGDDNINCFFSGAVVPLKKKKPGKNPDVDTSFLPDREREVMMTSESVKYFKRLCFLLISEKLTHKKIVSRLSTGNMSIQMIFLLLRL